MGERIFKSNQNCVPGGKLENGTERGGDWSWGLQIGGSDLAWVRCQGQEEVGDQGEGETQTCWLFLLEKSGGCSKLDSWRIIWMTEMDGQCKCSLGHLTCPRGA